MRLIFLFLFAICLSGCGSDIHKTTNSEHVQQPSSVKKPAESYARPAIPDRSASIASLPKSDSPSLPDFSEAEQDPRRLLDLGRYDLSSILGKPAFIRRDMSAEVWQYRTDTCVLDLFLYNFERNDAVTYYEFRPRRDGELVRDDCFIKLLQRGISGKSQS